MRSLLATVALFCVSCTSRPSREVQTVRLDGFAPLDTAFCLEAISGFGSVAESYACGTSDCRHTLPNQSAEAAAFGEDTWRISAEESRVLGTLAAAATSPASALPLDGGALVLHVGDSNWNISNASGPGWGDSLLNRLLRFANSNGSGWRDSLVVDVPVSRGTATVRFASGLDRRSALGTADLQVICESASPPGRGELAGTFVPDRWDTLPPHCGQAILRGESCSFERPAHPRGFRLVARGQSSRMGCQGGAFALGSGWVWD
ncbi:MAG TPA: hypothetical protein PK208_05565 [Fibrobacteria bacterium]|nr:hypothetical protein [Fibrobacteria bacterium]